jgi:2-phosphosulfolactate phosphatase
MTRTIDIAVLASEADEMSADCYVVVDVLRATTTIATLFEQGIKSVTVAESEATARHLARAKGALLCGEVGGLPPEGFDLGNSPVEMLDAELDGRHAVLFTTNGTRAFCQVAGKGAVLAGALANVSAIAVAASGHESVVVVCAGNAAGRRFALEDFATAAQVVQSILALSPGAETGDAAGMAIETWGYENWIAPGLPQQTDRSGRALRGSSHGRRTAELGFAPDIQFASRRDTSGAVPTVVAFGDGWALLEDRRGNSS